MALGDRLIGAVVIGRNEGERLETCLRSVRDEIDHIVYVDSGSTDGSIEVALRNATAVVRLSVDRPFSAARARNAGAKKLLDGNSIELIQFIDGDCELQPGWVGTATNFLSQNPQFAIVCGRRRERYPEMSRYNRLCDMEWDTPVGVTSSCGGDSLVRTEAFTAVGGFCEDLIAGEEPDLCFRIRKEGLQIFRLDAEMTRHDASMTRATQWWKRSVRSGFATAEAYQRRGDFEPALLRQVISNVVWALPVAWPFWPLLWLRVHRRRGALYATNIVLGKLPHLFGQVRFWWQSWRGSAGALIEYK